VARLLGLERKREGKKRQEGKEECSKKTSFLSGQQKKSKTEKGGSLGQNQHKMGKKKGGAPGQRAHGKKHGKKLQKVTDIPVAKMDTPTHPQPEGDRA